MDFKLHQLRPASPLVGGLVFKKRAVRALFQAMDWLRGRPCVPAIPAQPQKILVCNLGNLGDVLITVPIALALQERYPLSEFGFLVSSAGQSALEMLTILHQVHVFDHAYNLRSKMGICKAALHHHRNGRRVLDELKSARYDMAVDLQPFFPNAIPLFKRAAIPVRIGYPTGGFGSLLTHPFAWKNYGKYLGDLHIDHLREVGLSIKRGIYREELKNRGSFFVIQMQASQPNKNWHRAGWIQCIRALQNEGCEAILVGRGANDYQECEAVAGETGAINACDQWSIPKYAEVLSKAKLLISVDSMSLHLAALLRVPTLVALAEIHYPHLWIPANGLFRIVFLNEKQASSKMIELAREMLQ